MNNGSSDTVKIHDRIRVENDLTKDIFAPKGRFRRREVGFEFFKKHFGEMCKGHRLTVEEEWQEI